MVGVREQNEVEGRRIEWKVVYVGRKTLALRRAAIDEEGHAASGISKPVAGPSDLIEGTKKTNIHAHLRLSYGGLPRSAVAGSASKTT